MKKPLVLHFGGFGASGGSAIRDLLKEFEDIFIFPSEFRLLKEKNGLLDLEASIFSSRSPDNIDLAIRDFKELNSHLGRITTKFSRKGFDYNLYTDYQYKDLINKFIQKITDYKYKMFTHNYDFRKSSLKSQFDRYMARVFGYSFLEEESYMAYPSFEEFNMYAKELLYGIFHSSTQKYKVEPKVIALHNCINHLRIETILKSSSYFYEFKMLIIDRDPRDIFIDFPHKRYLPSELNLLEKSKCFVKFFLSIRDELEEIKKLDNILFIKFEDLILNYEFTKDKIIKFLNIDKKKVDLNKRTFLPHKSSKNIGLYKSLDRKYYKAIEYIEENLKDYLY